MTLPKNVLVVGRAKTGTTVIAKSIQHSLGEAWGRPCEFILEPKQISLFDDPAHADREGPLVAKLINDHWETRPRLRNAILAGELDLEFDRLVFITRDPRDELISRLMYVLHIVIARNGIAEEKVAAWRAVLVDKEQHPDGKGLFDLAEEFNTIFGTAQLGPAVTRRMCKNITRYWELIRRHEGDSRSVAIRYEDFIAGYYRVLEEGLGVPIILQRDVGNLDRVRRSESAGNWASFMTDGDLDFLRPLLAEEMAAFGYTDWERQPLDRLPSESYSGYVDKVVGLLRSRTTPST